MKVCKTGIYKKEAVGRDLISIIIAVNSITLDKRFDLERLFQSWIKGKFVSEM